MVTRTFPVFAASYDALGAAEADFQAVHEFYMVAGLLDTYQHAVAQSEAAVREAEAEAAAAERAAERYSSVRPRPAGDGLMSQLDDLAKLREAGVLSAAEFEAAKSRLLGE